MRDVVVLMRMQLKLRLTNVSNKRVDHTSELITFKRRREAAVPGRG
jgi:hypothetical protein